MAADCKAQVVGAKGQQVVQPHHRQDNDVVPTPNPEDNNGVPMADLLRESIDEAHVTLEYVAQKMTEAGVPMDRFYLSKMCSKEKPIGAKHLRALPDDVEKIFARRYAKTFGLIVADPITDLESAQRAYVASSMFLMSAAASQAAQLPAKAGAPAKADLRSTKKAEAV